MVNRSRRRPIDHRGEHVAAMIDRGVGAPWGGAALFRSREHNPVEIRGCASTAIPSAVVGER